MAKKPTRRTKYQLEDNVKRVVFVRPAEASSTGGGSTGGTGGTSTTVVAEIPYATRDETDDGTLTDKVVNPDGGAYAYDRLRHGAQHSAGKGTKVYTLTDATTIAINCRRSNVFEVTLNGLGNRTLGAPTSPYRGQTINILVTQGEDGSQTLDFDPVFTFSGGLVPVLSTTPGSTDLISCQYQESVGKWRCAFMPGFEESGVATSGVLLTDGDKGDITVSNDGQTFLIDLGVVEYGNLQDVSTTARVLGRKSSGTGVVEEISLTELLNFVGSAAAGDLLKRGASDWERLPIGTNGYVLKVVAGAPAWSQFTLATLTDVDTTGVADGDVLTYDSPSGKWIAAEPTGGTGGGTLDGLTGVAVYTAMDGDVLTYDAGSGIWIPLPPPAGSTTLDGLTDANTAGAVDGDVLTYDSGTATWVPAEPVGGTGGGTLDALTDVSVYSAVDGDVLTYDGASGLWIASPAAAASSLHTEILADSPMAYWILDETSGDSFADSSGNSYGLTRFSLTHALTYLDNSSSKYIARTTAGSGLYLSRSGALGFTPPLNGDWTVEALISPFTIGTNTIVVLEIAGSLASELSADNVQLRCFVATSGALAAFWENGAGTDVTVTSTTVLAQDMAYHIAFVKDGTANTVTFYVNGRRTGAAIAYTNEPTDGSGTMTTTVAGLTSGAQNPAAIGRVAVYNSKLSEARIRAHARAGGFI